VDVLLDSNETLPQYSEIIRKYPYPNSIVEILETDIGKMYFYQRTHGNKIAIARLF
jgi:hypothetical protein